MEDYTERGYGDEETSFPIAPMEARESMDKYSRFSHDHMVDETQPTDAGEEPMYGRLQENERLKTSVLDENIGRQGNLPSKLKGMTPIQRKLHIIVCVLLFSCIIFATLLAISALLIED